MWIDSHHHLWQYNPAEYPWMSEDMQTIRRDFTLQDLEEVAAQNDVFGSVVVQARQSLQETEWLLQQAESSSLIQGVVGWVPLIDPKVTAHLEEFADRPKLKGIRHALHDEADPNYMLREDFNRGVAKLLDYQLCYDLLIFPEHLPQTIEFVDKHPNQTFIVDHLAKPHIASGEITPWVQQIQELAKRDHVSCKVSGMVTEADWKSWQESELQPHFDVVLNAFRPSRLMFGSDWPVITLASSYSRWISAVEKFLHSLSTQEADAIRQGTVKRIYGLD